MAKKPEKEGVRVSGAPPERAVVEAAPVTTIHKPLDAQPEPVESKGEKTMSTAEPAAESKAEHPAQTEPAGVEQRLVNSVEDLERILGAAQSTASEWRLQQQAVTSQLIKRLTKIRDTADELLSQLGYRTAEAPAAVRRSPSGRLPGQKKRGPGRPPKAKKASGESPRPRGRSKGAEVRCKVCGVAGHNKRGHEKWAAANPEEARRAMAQKGS